jgi:hypothetical protein
MSENQIWEVIFIVILLGIVCGRLERLEKRVAEIEKGEEKG